MIIGAIGTKTLATTVKEDWLRNVIRSWLARWDVRLAYTCLESQVMVVFGEILCSANIPIRLILSNTPCLLSPELQKRRDAVIAQASACHTVDAKVEGDPGQLSRDLLIEHCEVVFFVMGDDQDHDLTALQVATCAQEIAVITIDLSAERTWVNCKFEQW